MSRKKQVFEQIDTETQETELLCCANCDKEIKEIKRLLLVLALKQEESDYLAAGAKVTVILVGWFSVVFGLYVFNS